MKNGKSILQLLGVIFLLVGIVLAGTGILAYSLVSGAWLYMMVMCLIGGIFLILGSVLFLTGKVKAARKQKLIDAGKFVYARIVDIDVDWRRQIQVDRIAMNPFFIRCRYRDENGREYEFKSGSLLYNPSGLLRSDRLKVYVDLLRPGKYYVDTNEILPEGAVLHKFKFDSQRNAKKLMELGTYVTAVTCGVELVGRLKVNGVFKPGFLKLPAGIARQFQIPLDEKGRGFLGYTILCRYEDGNGDIHIFASKGIWGEPDSAHIGEKVRVYYDGKGYRNYHVDLSS